MPEYNSQLIKSNTRIPNVGMLSSISRIAQILQSETSIAKRLFDSLKMSGELFSVTAVSLYEVQEHDKILLLRSRWPTMNITKASTVHEFDHVSFHDLGLEKWRQLLESGTKITGLTKDFSIPEQHYFALTQSLSVVLSPIFIEEKWWGFLQIEDSRNERIWRSDAQEKIDVLTALIGIALQTEKVRAKTNEIRDDFHNFRLLHETMTGEFEELKKWRDRISSSFSHEFQTPLYTLLGFTATLIENEELDEDKEIRRTCLQHIYEQSNRIEQILNELMYVSRTHTKKSELIYHVVDLRHILIEICSIFRIRANRVKLDFYQEVCDFPLFLYCDGNMIRQLLSILLDNAIKNTPESGWITLIANADENNIILKIADSGRGIPADDLNRIFEPFFTTTDSLLSPIEVGMGLSIAKDIVDLHEGFITVETKEGEGSFFTVILPRKLR